MEVAEISPQTGVSKSSTSMSESSHEVSVEKTATGSIEQESSLQRSVEQSVEKSVQQQSSHVVQKSVQSSVSDDKEKKPSIEADPTKLAGKPAEQIQKVELQEKVKEQPKDNEIKKETETIVNDNNEIVNGSENDEEEVEIVEVEDEEDEEETLNGTEVSVEKTIILKKEVKPEEAPIIKDEPKEEKVEPSADIEVEITLKAPSASIKETKPEKGDKVSPPKDVTTDETKTEHVKKEVTFAKEIEQNQEEKPNKEEEQQQPPKQTQSLISPDTAPLLKQNKSQTEETAQTVTTIKTTQITQKLEPSKPIGLDLITTTTTPQQAQSETETITSSTTSTTKSTDVPSEIKQDSIKNTLKEIISDIDRVIEQEEEQEQRQEQLSQPKEEELEKQQPLRQQSFQLQPSQIGPQIISSSTEKTNEVSGYTTKNEVIERSEVKDRDGSTRISSTKTTTIKSAPPPQYQYAPISAPNINSYFSHRSMSLPSHNELFVKAMQRSLSTQQFPVMRNPRPSIQSGVTLQRSQSFSNCTIEKKRGFKPSDRYDPAKKEFLVNLSKQIWHKEPKAPGPKPVVDLQKIFTPAADADEILPQKNRKLYASSAFYSPTLHPTVEDQVELARRISHSLSDISNQQSKGQSMYVNRKKRSVKWVHEGDGKAEVQQYNGFSEETKENSYQSMTSSTSVHHEKIPLKLLMNPRGQVQDMSTVPHQGFSIDCGLLSPDKCAELVTALHAPKGKGAELFAKRRKKSEKWIVDECSAATRSPSGLPYGRPTPTSPIVPAYSDLGVHRVQLNMHQDLVQDKYAQPRLKLVKTPWDAALETGSASAAFQDVRQPPKEEFGTSAAASYDYYQPDEPKPQYQAPPAQKFPMSKPVSNSQRDLAYKPSIPQGWNAPRADLPKGLYIPPEIPLDSYVPPPVQQPLLPPTKPYQQQLPIYVEPPAPSSFPTTYQPTPQLPIEQPAANFPITAKPSYAYQPGQQYAKQLQSNYLATSNKVKNASPTPFNPSPLSYDKLAKFEQSSADQYQTYSMPPLRKPLAVPANTKIRNTSPTPFGASPTFGSKAPNYIAPRAGPQMPAPTTVQQQQPQYQPQPQTQYQPPPQSQYQQPPPPQPREVQQPFYPPPEDNYYNKPNTNFNVGRVPSVDLSHCQNYNTAPRGWNQRSDYYRPITFSKGSTELPYTDF